jgi:hypothetical protein
MRQLPGVPPLTKEQAQECVSWILSDEAVRPPAGRGQRQKLPLAGEHISRQGKQPHLRGSDRSERVGVCVSLLMWAGFLVRNACVKVAALLKGKLGRSARGRPRRKGSPSSELFEKADTVRSVRWEIWNRPAEAEKAIQSWFWKWWHEKYTKQHPDRFPRRLGTISERFRDIQIRKIDALLACSQSSEETKELQTRWEAWSRFHLPTFGRVHPRRIPQ